ncbi:SCO1/SenC-domain-containing protein [Aspergillus pseudonomiae]|uniref:Protein SCO1 n=2 Tax=Aspergillus subgen. Circumdati TaxID=2720871 RepID=A0A0L1IUW9_ASPN3|nr:protein SCO1 [Aspergillus nomiae NRRL 13137]XP_031934609.1 SCO1/SenC-domain-containing protein [Aspergillus pseudonomiae]KAB8253970.1 SCO1/SenC-domain-containing protein [Aspergillus pseudonomiae]KAE8397290.1 SCO1/SenC-domain-containing protein [Aspergillus pseudonomiae]KNG82943.1 protein SCO1 [Aspergillus nomiae NRRL 13137]
MASTMRPLVQMIGRASRSSIPSLERSTLRSIPSQNAFVPLRTKPTHSAYTQTLRHNGLASQRSFSTTTFRARARTMGQLKARNSTGPFSWKSALLFVITGAAMIVYFRVEKERLARKRIAEMSKGVGRPKVGGPFVLKDLDGKQVTEEDLKGKYSFVYFGFTHCPDICPDELDKMAEIIDKVKEATKGENIFLPVFVTCDPARDTPEVLRSYLQEFHGDIIGLTGTYEQVKNMCKQYRVYFSTPQNVNPGEDYLVDHSIYFYLMDPEGDFVECIGRQDTPDSATKVILEHINDWKREGKPLRKD